MPHGDAGSENMCKMLHVCSGLRESRTGARHEVRSESSALTTLMCSSTSCFSCCCCCSCKSSSLRRRISAFRRSRLPCAHGCNPSSCTSDSVMRPGTARAVERQEAAHSLRHVTCTRSERFTHGDFTSYVMALELEGRVRQRRDEARADEAHSAEKPVNSGEEGGRHPPAR